MDGVTLSPICIAITTSALRILNNHKKDTGKKWQVERFNTAYHKEVKMWRVQTLLTINAASVAPSSHYCIWDKTLDSDSTRNNTSPPWQERDSVLSFQGPGVTDDRLVLGSTTRRQGKRTIWDTTRSLEMLPKSLMVNCIQNPGEPCIIVLVWSVGSLSWGEGEGGRGGVLRGLLRMTSSSSTPDLNIYWCDIDAETFMGHKKNMRRNR